MGRCVDEDVRREEPMPAKRENNFLRWQQGKSSADRVDGGTEKHAQRGRLGIVKTLSIYVTE